MNYQRIYDAVQKIVSENVPKATILLPNAPPKSGKELCIAIYVTETGVENFTESQQRKMILIEHVISVPESTGTERILNTAAVIQACYNPRCIEKSNLYIDGNRVMVRRSRQLAPIPNNSRFECNVNVECDFCE